MNIDEQNPIINFVKFNRSRLGLTQEELARKAGVGLRFIRDLEQGKDSLRMDKVNQLLQLFGSRLVPVPERKVDPYQILQYHMNGNVRLKLTNKTNVTGEFVKPVINHNEIVAWKFIHSKDKAEYKKSGDPQWLLEIDNNEIEKIENI